MHVQTVTVHSVAARKANETNPEKDDTLSPRVPSVEWALVSRGLV